MYYVNPIIKSFLRTNQPEGRGKYVRLDQNENPDGIPQWLFDKAMAKVVSAKHQELLGVNINAVELGYNY